jgi:hypothetical protein
MNTMPEPTSRGNRRHDPPASQAEALDMLQSALGYVQRSGLKVAAGNRAGVLTIQVDKAQLVTTGDHWELVPIKVGAKHSHRDHG